jgi:excisionase family DNA binding protein
MFIDDYPDILTPYEVMEILDLGKNTVYSLLNDGKIPGVRVGQKWRITKQALLSFLGL